MVWWVGVILVIVALAAVLGFFEWRSRNKPMPSRLADTTPGANRHGMGPANPWTSPYGTQPELEKPRDDSGL
jgi:hypothetical protein